MVCVIAFDPLYLNNVYASLLIGQPKMLIPAKIDAKMASISLCFWELLLVTGILLTLILLFYIFVLKMSYCRMACR